MKSLVVYAGRTGNTAKLAHAVFEALPGGKMLLPIDKSTPGADVCDLAADLDPD